MMPAPARRPATLVADGRELRRVGAALLAVAVVAPLAPAPLGVGCPLRGLTGIPCPLCGMTTSVVATVDLRLGDALAANPAGVLAVVVALAVLAWRPAEVRVRPAVAALALASMWVVQLHRFGFV